MSKETYKSATHAGYRLDIFTEDSPESPRPWSTIGTMVCFHRNYDLGDDPKVHGYKSQQHDSWKELADAIIAEHDAILILPLYLYDHSGITMSTGEFGCRFDSGQVGFIFCSRQKCIEEWGDDSPESIKKVEANLLGEVKIYDQYLTGDVYGYKLFKLNTCEHCGHTEDEELDSCCGFFGDDWLANGIFDNLSGIYTDIKEEADEIIESLIKQLK